MISRLAFRFLVYWRGELLEVLLVAVRESGCRWIIRRARNMRESV